MPVPAALRFGFRPLRVRASGAAQDQRRPSGGLSPERSRPGGGVVSPPGSSAGDPQAAHLPATADPQAAPLLELVNLKTYYPVRRGLTGWLARAPRRLVHAVDDVSFSIARGEMVALVGESGFGKTTTAQTIMRMVQATSGSVRLSGTDVTRLSPRQMRPLRRRLQIIYQDPYESLDPRFRVRQTIAEPML